MARKGRRLPAKAASVSSVEVSPIIPPDVRFTELGPQVRVGEGPIVYAVPKSRAERRFVKRQTEALEEREWWDRAERLLNTIAGSSLGGAIIGGLGGILAHEPTWVSLVRNSASGEEQGVPGFKRWVFTFQVENLYTHTLRFGGFSVPDPVRGGSIGLIPAGGWPDEWTIGVDFPHPVGYVQAFDLANRKLLSALRGYGFAAGSAFGLGMGAISGLRRS